MKNKIPHLNLYTRLKPSAHGVGVFAIRDIPADMRLFQGDEESTVRVPRKIVEKLSNPELRRIYFDFCPLVVDHYIAPADFNRLTMSWYMNHSKRPNVHTDHEMRFIATVGILANEELTIDYGCLSKHASNIVTAWSGAL